MNGRVDNVHPTFTLRTGVYMLHFDIEPYFTQMGMTTFFPYAEVDQLIVYRL